MSLTGQTVPVPREIAEWVYGLLKRRVNAVKEMYVRGFISATEVDQRDYEWMVALDRVLNPLVPDSKEAQP